MSRKTDALVAEHVMGWRIKPNTTIHYPPDVPFETPCTMVRRIPAYTTDAAADYSVLCKVRETWPESRFFDFLDSINDAWASRVNVEPWATYKIGDYSLAALSALGIEVSE